MSSLKDLQLYSTYPHECSYLQDRLATTLFVDPEYQIDKKIYTHLSELGFRRSGSHIYRPHCKDCKACIPCRVPVLAYTPPKRFRRVWKKNSDLEITRLKSIDSEECFQLYVKYINSRHFDGDMYPPTRNQYDSFLGEQWLSTEFHQLRIKEDLLGVIVTDRLENALSAVYTFFDPEQSARSLGNYAILWQIEQAKHLNLAYVYLGFWIKECQKMNYKVDYRPIELFTNNRWVVLN